MMTLRQFAGRSEGAVALFSRGPMPGRYNARMRPPLRFTLLALLLAAGCERAPVSSVGADAAPVALPVPAAAGARLPRLSEAGGVLWLSWVEPRGESGHALRYAVFEDGSWSAPIAVAEGQRWFVNWADFPSVVPLPGGGAAAHWLRRSGDAPYAYDVVMAVSANGLDWSRPVTPHGDGTTTEHGFVSLFPDGDGVGAVWLDGRRMAGAGGHDGHDAHGAAAGGAMTLRAGLVDRAGTAVSEAELDSRTCDCCQTAAVVTETGPLVFYRDRSEDELRDIRVVARTDGVWGEPTLVAADGWRIAGCPVNGPAAAASGARVAVAWFTAADERPRVLAAFSDEGAKGFRAPVEVAAGTVSGRVGVALLSDGDAVVSWVAAAGDGAEIRYRRVAADGQAGPPHTLTRVDAARSAGFPQLASGGDGLVFAWTAPGESAGVLSATVPVPAD